MASFPASNKEFVWMSVTPTGQPLAGCERRFGFSRLLWVPAVTCLPLPKVTGISWVMALLRVLATAGNGDLAFSRLLITG